LSLQTIFGLSSAVSFGTGDFCGALAAKKNPALTVVVFSQIISGSLLLLLYFVTGPQIPGPLILLRSCAAGLSGSLALMAFYSALSSGHIAVAAPLAAVLSCAVPALVGFFTLGFPGMMEAAGFGFALVAILLLSLTGKKEKIDTKVMVKALAAGFGFGLYFLFTAGIPREMVLPSLLTARICSVTILFLIGITSKKLTAPGLGNLPLIAAAGLFDTGGNALYIMSSTFGRFDAAVILTSLYPAVTVILSAIILKEKMTILKIIGGMLAVLAVILLTGGS
jgi:drug/metabolite transporter (DMT)-like permease